MKTLIWKEYLEKRNWFWLLLAAILFPTLVLCFQTPFAGDLALWKNSSSSGEFFRLFINVGALIFGMTAYKYEVLADTASFIMARPVGWKKIMLAKILVGLGIMFFSITTSAFIYYLALPTIYKPAMTLSVVIYGILSILKFSFLYYIVGFSVSMFLPGIMGSSVILLGNVALLAVLMGIINTYKLRNPFVLLIVCGIALITGSIYICRFGITLPIRQRIARYAILVSSIVIVSFGILQLIPDKTHYFEIKSKDEDHTIICLSPSAKTMYSIKLLNSNNNIKEWKQIKSIFGNSECAFYIKKISDEDWTIIKLTSKEFWNQQSWVYDDKLLTQHSPLMALYWLDNNSKLRQIKYNVFGTNAVKQHLDIQSLNINPSKTIVMITSSIGVGSYGKRGGKFGPDPIAKINNKNTYCIVGVLNVKKPAYHRYTNPILLPVTHYYGWLNDTTYLFKKKDDKFITIDFSNMVKPEIKNISLDEVKKLVEMK